MEPIKELINTSAPVPPITMLKGTLPLLQQLQEVWFLDNTGNAATNNVTINAAPGDVFIVEGEENPETSIVLKQNGFVAKFIIADIDNGTGNCKWTISNVQDGDLPVGITYVGGVFIVGPTAATRGPVQCSKVQLVNTGSSTFKTVLKPSATIADVELTLPTTQGAAGDVVQMGAGGVMNLVKPANQYVVGGLPIYADDAAAGAGGLVQNQLYQTDGTGAAPLNVAGIVMIKQ